jgi:hypothetical protein
MGRPFFMLDNRLDCDNWVDRCYFRVQLEHYVALSQENEVR